MSFLKINDRVFLRTSEILAIDVDELAAWLRVKDQPTEAACISIGDDWGKTPEEKASALARAIDFKEAGDI